MHTGRDTASRTQTVDHMARNRPTTQPTTRTTRTATAIEPTATATAIEPIEPTTAVVVPEPTATDVMAERFTNMFPGVPVVPFIVHAATAFAATAHMPVTSRDDRDAARAVMVATMVAGMGDRAIVSKTVGRFSNMHVFESQNSAYVAAAVSGTSVTDGHFVAMWSTDLPIARCDYMGTGFERGYPSSTLSEYIAPVPRHGIVPNVPGARDAVVAWVARKRNRPTA